MPLPGAACTLAEDAGKWQMAPPEVERATGRAGKADNEGASHPDSKRAG